MRLLERIAARVFNTPLLITPEYGSVITTVLADRLNVEPMVGQDIVDSYIRPNNRDTYNSRGGVMTVPVIGGLVHRSDGPDALSGVQSYTSLHNKFEALFADNKTRGILLDLDTGGGEAAGLAELVDWLPKASAQAGKPVWGIANTTTGSAAYWLASSLDRLYAAPNSRVGSIGVYVQHTDVSKAMEKRGIVTSFVYAGAHKIDGHPFAALSDDVRASIQTRVDKLYVDFVNGVASNRDLDPEAVRGTEAQVYGPEDAYALGLVDGIGNYGEVLAAFTEHLNRPFVGYSSHGDNLTMTTKALYDQDALDRARAEGVSEGQKASATALEDLKGKLKAATDERSALLAAFADIAGKDNPRVSTFVEALNDGVNVASAAKFAMKIEAPKAAPVVPAATSATEADVDKLMNQHAASISDNAAEIGDPKAARMAEIAGSMTAFNQAKGYGRSAA